MAIIIDEDKNSIKFCCRWLKETLLNKQCTIETTYSTRTRNGLHVFFKGNYDGKEQLRYCPNCGEEIRSIATKGKFDIEDPD